MKKFKRICDCGDTGRCEPTLSDPDGQECGHNEKSDIHNIRNHWVGDFPIGD